MVEKKISLFYKLLVLFSLLTGIVLNLVNTSSIIAILSYYTLQSNIVCFFTFFGTLILIFLKKDYRNGKIYYVIKGGVVIAIFITAIIYQIALMPYGFQMDYNFGNRYLANMLVHEISPTLVILDYFIFDCKGKFKWFYPFFWLFIPFFYVIYVYTYPLCGGRFFAIGGSRDFAYVFLDYNQIGYIGVAKFLIAMTIFILAISYLLVLIDKKLGNLKK